ncbi:hypothetical protein [uncultured Azohydromonas sp.]|jgi:hypothetical protein|uniref:hypothetical protein n=1 Tax=uncultured Azohydromonas sp. TaxID=487342 RepID=UPI002612151C|nr:hypothetical protein [uncultured Azohydromonas sp.]
MELLLILVVGGLAAWLMRPLRDWYVLEVQDASGASLGKTVFTQLDAAEQAFQQAVAKEAGSGAPRVIYLWHAEARSRKEILSGQLPEGKQVSLVRTERVTA